MSSLSYRVYEAEIDPKIMEPVEGDEGSSLKDTILNGLSEASFKGIDRALRTEATGIVGYGSRALDYNGVFVDPYIRFALRRDRISVPANAVEEEADKRCEALAESGEEIERVAIEEQVRHEMAMRALPKTTLANVVHDDEARLLRVFGGAWAEDHLPIHLFEDSRCRFATWDRLAVARLTHNETIEPDPYIRTPAGGYDGDDAMGREFLTWLWYESERDDTIVLGDGIEPAVFALTPVKSLALAMGSDVKAVFSAENTSELREAMGCLVRSYLVTKMTVKVVVGSSTWQATLHAKHCGLSGVKLPVQPTREDEAQIDEADLFLWQMDEISLLDGMISRLFGRFITLRLGDDWGATRAAVAKWIYEGAK